MEGEKKPYNKGGHMSRYEPLNTHEMMSSRLAKQCFQNVGCMRFCEQIQIVKYHAKLTSLFATNIKGDKVIIAGVSLKISFEQYIQQHGYLIVVKMGLIALISVCKSTNHSSKFTSKIPLRKCFLLVNCWIGLMH